MIRAYERFSERLLRGQEKTRDYGVRVCRVIEGRVHTSHKSLHKTPQGVRFRRFWRMKTRRLFGMDF